MADKFLVNCQGLSLPLPRRMAVESAIRNRTIELAGDAQRLKHAFDAADRKINPASRFNLYFDQAVYEAMEDLDVPPSCRKELRPVPRWEKE